MCLSRHRWEIRRKPRSANDHAHQIPFRLRAGQSLLRLQGVMPTQTDVSPTLCADMDGFSPHAAALRIAG